MFKAEQGKSGAIIKLVKIKNIDWVATRLDSAKYEVKGNKQETVLSVISDLYSIGYGKEAVLKDKFLRKKINDISFSQKDFKHLVEYVYTKDETNHSFGGWIAFDYYLPLYVFDYAETLIAEYNLKVNKYKFASFLFFIAALGSDKNKKLKRKINREIGYLRKHVKERENPFVAKETLELLKTNKNDALVIYKPSKFYKNIGIDGRTFSEYSRILNNFGSLSVEHKTLSFGEDDFKNRIYIFGAKKLAKKIYKLGASKYKPPALGRLSYEELKAIIADNVHSDKVKSLWNNYELYFARSSKNKNYFAKPSLSPNLPFVRAMRARRKRILCFAPFEFFNIKVWLYAFYNNIEGIDFDFSLIPAKEYNDGLIKLFNKTALSLSNKSKREDFDFINKFKKSEHFKQIKGSFEVVKELSNAGIGVDVDKINELLKSKDNKFNEREIKELKKIKKAVLSDIRNNYGKSDFKRLYGRFTPHGGLTHRVISGSYNLQGISKKVRKSGIFIAPEGYSLLSYDVSGQDLSVALDFLEELVAEHPEIFEPPKEGEEKSENDDNEKEEKIICGCKEVVEKRHYAEKSLENAIDGYKEVESGAIESLIDFVIKRIKERIPLCELEEKEECKKYSDAFYLTLEALMWATDNNPDIRGVIKSFVYTAMYGGSENAAMDNVDDDVLCGIRGLLSLYVEDSVEDEIKAHAGNLFRYGNSDNLEGFLKEAVKLKTSDENIYLELESYIYLILIWQDYKNAIEGKKDVIRLLNKLDIKHEDFKEFNFKKTIYDLFRLVLEEEFCCLFDALKYFEDYYKAHHLTYPTRLKWQTVVSVASWGKKSFTSSKNTPIQAIGAELMRGWLMNLRKAKKKENLDFRIINAIHDQIVLEVKNSHLEKTKYEVNELIKKAAKDIGINPDLIKLGAPKIDEGW